MRSFSGLWILLAAMLWGTTGTAQSFTPAGTSPFVFGAMRLLIGGGALFLFVWIQGNYPWRYWLNLRIWIAAFCMAAFQPLFFTAVSETGIAVGTFVAIGSAPVLAGLMEWVIHRKAPTLRWMIATGAALSGCILLFSTGTTITVEPVGVVLALGAGLSFAGYALVSKSLTKHSQQNAVVATIFSLSALFLLPTLFFFDLSWLADGKGLLAVLHLGVLTTGVAYVLFAKGLARVTSATAVTLTLAEPLTATLLGVLVVGEVLSAPSWMGVGLILVGMVVLSVPLKMRKYV